MKKILFVVLLCPYFLLGQSFHPAAGSQGTTAIHKDSNVFVAWANGIFLERGYLNISDTNVNIQGNNRASFGDAQSALGMAEGNASDIVSLGDNGSAVLMFEYPISDGPGYDFAVFENSFSDNFLELAHVAVSSDGINYVTFESNSENSILQQIGPFGQMQPEYINNLAGKYRAGYGTPFDLEELLGEPLLDLQNIRFVKITDCVGSIDLNYGTLDRTGTPINDPFPTPFESCGFDLDAVGVIHQNDNLGFDDVKSLSVSLYPNPFREDFQIKLKVIANYEVELINMQGAIVHSTSFYGANTSIQFDGDSGVYLLRVLTENGIYQQRIIKQP